MKRDFCLGSEWLYYKIYTGVKTADLILLEKLHPIILDLKAKNSISKWFFIRYKDPEDHIRIRFCLEKPKDFAIIISKMHPVLNTLLEENSIWKIQADTYQREIERYGKNTMIDSETLFWYDSEMILSYLGLKPYFIKNETQLLFSFYTIDSFLNSFSLTVSDKLNLMNELQVAFKREFDADKNLKKEMDKQYRELFPEIGDFLTGKAINEYPEIFNIIAVKQTQTIEIAEKIKGNLDISLSSFLMSHIHMTLNRQYTSKQRFYELLIYDHLHRYYKMLGFKQFNL
jgi:thiopeptide-type bacteriocin biosynthesis protein